VIYAQTLRLIWWQSYDFDLVESLVDDLCVLVKGLKGRHASLHAPGSLHTLPGKLFNH
jgi:hypothetical protein